MSTRQLLTVDGDRPAGALTITDGEPEFVDYAGDVLAPLRRKLGDQAAAEAVMADGWSNGYLYFGDPK